MLETFGLRSRTTGGACWSAKVAVVGGCVVFLRGVLVNFAHLCPPAAATRPLGKPKHRGERCYDQLKPVATAGRSVVFLEWLLFQNSVLAVIPSRLCPSASFRKALAGP
jgi:hypothetical protein